MATTDITYAPLITEEDQTLAKTTVEAILRSGKFRLEADGQIFVVPPSAAKQIVSVLNLTAENVPSEVIPAPQELTLHQAAIFLGMTEPHILELLNCGAIEFRQDGENRMVLQDSLVRYDKRKKQGLAAMDEIIRISEEIGLYDE